MATKKEWNDPTKGEDNKFEINVMTIAPMVEMSRGNVFETTGKEEEGKENRAPRSDELAEGMTIKVENSVAAKEVGTEYGN